MSTDNTRDWPTFTDILDELNALGPAQKQDPILMRHLGPQRVGDASHSEPANPDVQSEVSVEPSEPESRAETVATVDAAPFDVEAEPTPGEVTSIADVNLPDELEPSAIDTAALDEAYVPDVGEPIDLDTSALDPVEASEVELEDLDTSDVAVSETVDAAPVDNPFEGDAPADVDGTFEPIDNPFVTDDAAGVDPLTGEIDWSTWDGAPAVQAEAPTLGDFDFNATPEQAAIESTPPPPSASDADSELPTWSAPENDENDETDTEPAFDSVATADAIENELQELFDLDQVTEENNVVPLHPSSDDHSDAVVGLDAVFDQDAEDAEPLQEWVGIKPEELRPADPWAHMRPDEESDVKGGFWKNRKKFFGGDERRAKRAERDAATGEEPAPAVPMGPPCPNCSAPGHIDLQDPVGGKLHLSCSSCDTVWAVRYDSGEQKSA